MPMASCVMRRLLPPTPGHPILCPGATCCDGTLSARLREGRRSGVQAPDAMALALLPCQFQGSRQEVRQRGKGPAGLNKDGQKIRGAGLRFRALGERNIILALQVCEEWVLR